MVRSSVFDRGDLKPQHLFCSKGIFFVWGIHPVRISSSSLHGLNDQRLPVYSAWYRMFLSLEYWRTTSCCSSISIMCKMAPGFCSEEITSSKQNSLKTVWTFPIVPFGLEVLKRVPVLPVALTYRYVVASRFSRSLACATATLMHCSHSSACFSSSAFSTYVLLSVKISKARGRPRSRRFFATIFTLWTLLSSIVLSSSSSFWVREQRNQVGLNNTVPNVLCYKEISFDRTTT